MVIKLLSSQIPMFWEAIKFAAISADEIDKENWGVYLNKLLHSLLNDRSQCFVRLDNERRLLALLVTRFSIDRITNEKSLFIQALYSWKRTENKEWEEVLMFVRKFAENEKCKYISFESRNPRIWQLTAVFGFKEELRSFKLSLGGV
jgi:hypothetical protein